MSEYNCLRCLSPVGKSTALRSQELHGFVLCMRCHLKLREKEHALEALEELVLSPGML